MQAELMKILGDKIINTKCDLKIFSYYLMAVGGSLVVFTGCKNKKVTVVENVQKKELWTCSMHPELSGINRVLVLFVEWSLVRKRRKFNSG
jgi:hypothetical protein